VPEFRSFRLLDDQYRIDDNWHVTGLQGPGSKDIVVENAFVPEYRSQSLIDYAMNAPLQGQERNKRPPYRLPWSVVFNTALVASVLGSSRDLSIPDFADEGPQLELGWKSGRRFSDAAARRDNLAYRCDGHPIACRYRVVVADGRGVRGIDATKSAVRWNMNRGCDLVVERINDLFRASTGRAVFVDHPLQKAVSRHLRGDGSRIPVSGSAGKGSGRISVR
jgi:3-hydroxy-9,10-secoandrosta-1,3,5(10)-triene-9,17-dione monooxygenase